MKTSSFFRSRIQAIKIAFEGIRAVLLTQPNVKVYLFFSLAAVAAGWILKITRQEWILLAITIGLVWAAEAFNTAVEELVDLVSPDQDPRAKIVKDVSAGAVLISALLSIVVGLLLFGPPLWAWIKGII